ncbi:MFS transporter, partial [Caldalkalibacillus salinus]|uniref:MFS transporter n=1 Tax=Caldalkalibacillus salinus TaxID=2803787 RepID=UPI0019240EA1
MKKLFGNRSFLIMWLAQFASGLGSTFATFVTSVLVYHMTGSKIAMGGIWIAYFVPKLIMSIVSGPYIDRLDYKKIMIFSELGLPLSSRHCKKRL